MSTGTPHRATVVAVSATAIKLEPVTHRTAFLDQNVELPLRLSETEIGVVLDRHGCDVFTVDVNNQRPDDEALAIALLIVEAVNAEAGFTTEHLDA